MEGLKNANVEDGVDARAVWQSKAVGDVAHALHHLKGSRVAWAELTAGIGNQRLGGAVQETEADPIADVELQRAVMSSVVALGVVLGLQQLVTYVGEESVAVQEQGVDRSSARRCWFIGHHRRRRATVHQL